MHARLRFSLVLAAVLAACAPNAPATTPQTGGAAQTERRSANQVLRYAQIGLPATMSPEASAANLAVYGAMYDALTTIDGRFNAVPMAATRWETVNPTTYRFFLRQGMTFSNGDPVTASDVEFTGRLMLQNRTPQIGNLSGVTGFTAVDQNTIEITTRSPDASVLTGLAFLWIMPRAYYERVGQNGFAARPIGSGPYELVEFRAGDFALFRKRTTPHPFRNAIATEIQARSITEQTQMVAGLRTGDLDIVYGALSPDVVEQIARLDVTSQGRQVSNVSALFSQQENRDRNTPLTDRRVRLALNYAVNKEAIANQLYRGTAIATGQLANPASPAWDPNIRPIPYDPARARQLLAEAGYPNGFRLPIGIEFTPQTANSNMVLAVQSDLRAVGVEAQVHSIELAAFLDKFFGRAGQTKGDLFVTSVGDINGFATTMFGYYTCDRPLVWWCNPEFDRNMLLANAEPDPERRGVLMRRALAAMNDDVAHLHLIVTSLYLVQSNKMRGFEWGNTYFFRFDDFYRID